MRVSTISQPIRQNTFVKPPTPEEIRKARQKAGLTQTEAAEKVWMSLRAWQDWEAGKRTMLPAVFWAFQQRTKHRVKAGD